MTKPSPIDLRAQALRAALATVAEANGGYLNPAAIVEAAKDPESVLHAEFEWDDDEAAHAYRVAQAGALIRRVKFTIVRTDPKTKEVEIHTTREWQSPPSSRKRDKGYEQVDQIMKSPEKRDELIGQVLKELAAYRKRYAELMALSNVWEAIDAALEEVAPPQGKAGQAGRGLARRAV